MEDLLTSLNDKQREAVEYVDGPALVLAGAGSGKTRVLTYKIAYLISKEIVKPYEILAITFTNKAAREMKERTANLLGPVANDVWLGTFHSICIRILKREIERLGYTRNFNIFDEDDKNKLLKEIVKELEYDDKEISPKLVGYEISSAKDKLITPEKYLAINKGDYRKEKFANVYARYQKSLKKNDALDFDDIINLTVELFEEYPDRLEYYQNKFKYILVDEYQDTNKSQFTLIKLLAAHGNISVVGDESQSIYGWRGADITNILNFENQFENAKVIKLEENYRSTKNILNAANEVIKNNESRLEKNLWTNNEEGEKIEYNIARNEYDEARKVIAKILELRNKEKYSYSDCAILYRTNVQSRAFEEILMQEGIPYKLIGGLKFYGRKEIKDVMAYLKLINNQKDNISLRRIINEPKRGIGPTTVEKLTDLAVSLDCSIFEVLQKEECVSVFRCQGKLREFVEIINDLISKKDTMDLSEFVALVLEKTKYLEALKEEKTEENQNRIENIYELLGVVAEFEKEDENNNLTAFLDNIALVSDVDKLDEEEDSVTLMTLHSAKGLEYKVIFLVGMEEGLFPSGRSIGEIAELEEERRLCYVGITRAREKLFLSCANQRTIYGRTEYTMPSRFVEEIPNDLIETEEKYKPSYNYKKEESSPVTTSFGRTQIKAPSFGIDPTSFLTRMNRPSAKAVNLDDYKVGIKVEHKKFGIGTILKVEKEDDDLKVEVKFDRFGMKRMMAKFAGLNIIQ